MRSTCNAFIICHIIYLYVYRTSSRTYGYTDGGGDDDGETRQCCVWGGMARRYTHTHTNAHTSARIYAHTNTATQKCILFYFHLK